MFIAHSNVLWAIPQIHSYPIGGAGWICNVILINKSEQVQGTKFRVHIYRPMSCCHVCEVVIVTLRHWTVPGVAPSNVQASVPMIRGNGVEEFAHSAVCDVEKKRSERKRDDKSTGESPTTLHGTEGLGALLAQEERRH